MNKEIEQISLKIRPILEKQKVIGAGIFGSYARGEQKEKSDVDILVKIEENASLLDILKLRVILEKLLEKKVDLVEYDSIIPELRNNILREEIKII